MPKITAIKLQSDHVEIEYTESHDTETVASVLKSAGTPTAEFISNFGKLKTLANEICDGHLVHFENYTVTQIRFKENKAGAVGCMLHVQIKLETNTRPLHFNTPPKYTLAENQDASEFYLEGESADLLRTLIKNAVEFMAGVRAVKRQQEINFDEPVAILTALEPKPETPTPEPETPAPTKPVKLRRNRRTCFNCNDASTMVIDGVGYCDVHGKGKLVKE